jgi:fucose permease
MGYTVAPSWWVMLGCAAVTGYGVGTMDGGLNAYAALRFSSAATNWVHGFYALGASVGPAIMTGVLVAGGDWHLGYLMAGAMLAAVTIGFLFTRARWRFEDNDLAEPGKGRIAMPVSATLRLKEAWFGIGLFALYTGVEVSAGQWTFTVLTQGRGVATGSAGAWVTAYYVGLTLGRIGIGTLTGIFPPDRVLRISIALSVVAATVFWLDFAPWTGFAAMFALGLCFGPVFPSLISTTPKRVGRAHTPNLVGFQVTGAAAGAALIPGGFGLIARFTGVEEIPAVIAALTVALLALFIAMERSSRRKA